MKLPNFLSNQTDRRSSSSSTTTTWPWPSCTQTRTLSFRASSNDNNKNIFKTINSAFRTTTNPDEPLDSSFTNSSSETTSFSMASDDQSAGAADPVEAVIQGLRSTERLFFKPEETNSILEEAKPVIENGAAQFKESVALSMESKNPYLDFKKSMEEMVEAGGIKEWERLEELLCCYLKINEKENHGYIVGAFIDLLVGLFSIHNNNDKNNDVSNKSCSCSTNCDSPCSPLSFCNASSTSSSSRSSGSTTTTTTTTPCMSSIGEDQNSETPCLSSLMESTEEEEEEDDDEASS